MLPLLVIGAAALLVIALTGKSSGGVTASGDKYTKLPGGDALKKAGDAADAEKTKTESDVLTGVGIGVSVVGTLTPVAIGIAKAFGGASAGAGGASGASSVSATSATGVSAASGGNSAAAVSASTGATLAASEAVVTAPLMGLVAALVIIVAFITIWLSVEQANIPAKIIGDKGVPGIKRRMRYQVFSWEEDYISAIMERGKLPVHKSLTFDGVANDENVNIEPLNIPTIEGQATYYIDNFRADKDTQRQLIDITRWVALAKVEAMNEYLRSYYFVRFYESRFALPTRKTEDSIAECNRQMAAEGFALTEIDFNTWRDNELFPSLNRRAWKEASIIKVGKSIKEVFADTVFDSPPMYWGECDNVARSKLSQAALLKAKLRVTGHGMAIPFVRMVAAIGLDGEGKILQRMGYTTRNSKEWPGQLDYVDTISQWYFTPKMVLRDENGNIVQSRVS